MYTVYGKIFTRSFRTLWMLEEIGEPYEFVEAGPHSEAVKDLNVSGKVPVLVVDGTVVTDSTAQLTFLADRHGKLTHPAGSLDRAKQDAVTHQILDEVDAVLWTAARHSFILPEEQRVEGVKDSLKWEFARNLDRIANTLDGPFVMGDMMTINDIILTHCLNWAFNAKFPIESDKVKAYAKTMRDRDAFKRVMARAN